MIELVAGASLAVARATMALAVAAAAQQNCSKMDLVRCWSESFELSLSALLYLRFADLGVLAKYSSKLSQA